MKAVATLLFFTSLTGAQTFTAGVKGGGFLTDPAERSDQSRRYLVGPSFEVGLPARFAVEVNGLYSRFGSSLRSGVTGQGVRGNAWQFPVLGKYYFAARDSDVKPFASAGVSFRKIWLDSGSRFGRVQQSDEPGVGAVTAGGVSLKLWKLRIAPEIRYTRWGGSNFPASNPNELQALVGIQF